jgi:hypothetical protein
MKLKTTFALLPLAGLFGCASLVPATREPPVVRFAPAPVITPQMSAAQNSYAQARQAHELGQLTTAARHYRRALDLAPDHVGALNGLGVILAQDGRTAEAIELLVRARDLDPKAGHIHNNLGYTLLREQRLDDADVALRMARELQPLSQQTLRNLALLDQARREQALAAAAPFQSTDPAEVAPATTAVATEPVTGGHVPQIVAVAPQVYELRLSSTLSGLNPVAKAGPTAAPPEAREIAEIQPMPEPQPGHRLVFTREMASFTRSVTASADGASRLEVSNGAGVAQLARRTADRLAQDGVVSARLTNARHYRFPQTQIEYLPGQDAAVQAVADRLPVHVKLVPVARLDRHMSLRLVLGQDAAGQAIAAWLGGDAAQVAQTAPAVRPIS